MINFYATDDEEEPCNFLYKNNGNIYNDASFVSIDLNDDKNECDICHQATEERTVNVMLSDEYLKFEGSLNRKCGSLTKAHEICLERWSEVIERNLENSSPTNGISNENSKIPSHKINIQEEEVKHENDLDDRTEKYSCHSKNENIEEQNLCSSIKSHALSKHMLSEKSK